MTDRLLQLYAKFRKSSMWKKLVIILASLVVFTTTYAMILPAITLDENSAEEEPGIVLNTEETEVPEEIPEESAEPAPEPTPEESADTQEPENTPEGTPEVTPEPTPEPTPENTVTPEPVQESTEPTQTLETSPETTPETTPDTTAEPSPETTPESTPEPSEEPEEIRYPEFLFREKLDRYNSIIEIKVSEDTLPEGTEAEITVLEELTDTEDTDKQKIHDALYDAYGDAVSHEIVQILFRDKDGEIVQPLQDVEVSYITGIRADAEEPLFLHISERYNENNEKEYVFSEPEEEDLNIYTDTEINEQKLVWKTGSFPVQEDELSLYAVFYPSIPEEYPAAEFSGETDEVTVKVKAPAGAFPAGTTMVITEIAQEDVIDQINEAVTGNVVAVNAVDITFYDAEGKPVEPLAAIKVRMTPKKKPAREPVVVHVDDTGVNVVEDTSVENTESEQEVSFNAESFSVYALVYTVDFYYEMDGKEYELSLAGGDSIGFRELSVVLHIFEDIMDSLTPDESALFDMDQFISDIDTITFSDETLVQPVKITEDTTAGAVKEALGITPEYSEDLTEEQIAEMDAKTYTADDWALFSLKAFDTEEYLTVTMITGESFTVKVTDAQIVKEYLTASGETYVITLNYEDDAEIPEDADLEVREVLPDTVEYDKYITDSANEMGIEAEDISFARFFDIEITKDGEKIEPKAPVQVTIEYKDSITLEPSEALNIVHFGEKETEIITDAELTEENKKIVYTQGSFSVTGTIVNGNPNQGNAYMLLVKTQIEGSDVYCIINNDGTLTPVSTNPDGTVNVDEPMMWTYRDNHILHNYDAAHIDMNSSPDAFYYRYLNPGDSSGITTESASNSNIWPNMQDNWRQLWNSTAVSYNNGNHTLSNNGQYLGITVDENGVMRVTGTQNAANAAQIYMASANQVKPPQQARDAVNHIDISIVGTSKVDIPLAYGNYYDAQGNLIKTVTSDEMITAESSVDITIDDMKRATITAYQIDRDGSIVNLDNAFYITGYSKNRSTEFSTDQVRIEGSFSTANAMHGENLNQFDNASQTYKNRLDNRVYYSVTVTKPITFVLKDEHGTELYDAEGNKMEITIDVAMAASFNYWDPHNECPPLQEHVTVYGMTIDNRANHREWLRGGYPANFGDITGMDFVLGGDAEDANSQIVALEITKIVVDESGKRIHPAEAITNKFYVYQDADGDPDSVVGLDVDAYDTPANYEGYMQLHSKNATVGSDGMGLVYDYDVRPGMFYIEEDRESVPDNIVDRDGTDWTYLGTRIETEYPWRDSEYDGHMHISNTYNKDSAVGYNSIPEVLGNYRDIHGNTTWIDDGVEKPIRNGFLEFFVYNIYRSGTKLEVEKQWDPAGSAPANAEVTVELQYRKRLAGHMDNGVEVLLPEADRGEWTEYADVKGAPLFDTKLNTTQTLRANSTESLNWKGVFSNLPKTLVDTDGSVYEVDYNVRESAVKIPGPGKTVIDEDAVDVTDQYNVTVTKTEPSAEEAETSDGKSTIINQQKGSLQVTKNVTYNGGTVPDDKKSLVNKSFTFTVTKDGTPIEGSPFTITVTNGVSNSVLVEDLEPGEYVITETDDAGLTRTSAESVTVTVTAGKITAEELLDTAKAYFTNNYSDTSITLKKVDSEDLDNASAETLKGAKFILTKYTDNTFVSVDTDWTPITLDDVKKSDGTYTYNGSFTFTDLPAGYYMISEPRCPDGYVKTGSDPAIEIRQKGDTTELEAVVLIKGSGNEYVEDTEGSSNTVRVANAANNTINFGNEAGVELPKAGGSGTGSYMILGGVLVMLAGYLLLRRYRTAPPKGGGTS